MFKSLIKGLDIGNPINLLNKQSLLIENLEE